MNKKWVDEKFEVLFLKLGIFKPNPDHFYFEPTGEFYKKLDSGDESDLRDLTKEIAEHLEIATIPTVRYDWGLKMDPEVAGEIKVASPARYIRIPFFYVGKKHAVGAVLAHEITHAFLIFKQIFLENPDENEMFTDLAAVFIGLGKLLLNGIVLTEDKYTDQGHMLGYLSPELIAYCYEKANSYRSIDREIAMKNLIPTAQSSISIK